MKIQFRGKYSKKNNLWEVEILSLELSFEAQTAMQAFHLLHKYLKQEIHEDVGCHIRIQDSGEFILVSQTDNPQMVTWLTTKISLLQDSHAEILDQILFNQELDDDE